jgi:hypothetical protein
VKSKKIVLLSFCALAGLTHAEPLLAQAPQRVSTKMILSGTVPEWLSRAQKLGPVDEHKRVVIDAYLSWRNQGQLEQLIEDQPHRAARTTVSFSPQSSSMRLSRPAPKMSPSCKVR